MDSCPHHESLGEEISLQPYSIAHLLERLKFKALNTPHIGKGMEERELSYSPVEYAMVLQF